ncbi:MAG: nucleotidyltransferase family protein [Phycisphaerae bacterium]|nr:nucleotidyltransferase family protein [Phycisphaerae bacterium]
MTQQTREILKTLSENRTRLERLGIQRLGLFGSSVRGEAQPQSDLDFLVEFKTKSFDAYMDLKFFLEELFQRNVDLVLADAIKPRLKPTILSEAVYAPGFEGLS